MKMMENSQLQSLSQLNQEMADAVLKLRDKINNNEGVEVERLKALILVLQKKIFNALH